jgi:hypothetical protein
MSNTINHTSVDDMRSSVALMNPESKIEIRSVIDRLSIALSDELRNKMRTSVITLLNKKINSLEKKLNRI